MPDTQLSLIKTRAGHFIFFLWSLFLPACVCVCVCVCVCAQENTSRCRGVRVCTLRGLQIAVEGPGSRHVAALFSVHTHTSHPQRQSVSVKRRNPDAQKICLGANFCRLVPFELRLALSHVLHKPQVNKLSLTADFASGEEMLEVGVLFPNRPKHWEYYLPWFIFSFKASGLSSRIPRRQSFRGAVN